MTPTEYMLNLKQRFGWIGADLLLTCDDEQARKMIAECFKCPWPSRS